MVFDITSMTENKAYNRIKAVLAEKGKTNIWLAQELGKNKTSVSKWCTNDVQPPIETLFKIADVLEVDVRELLVASKK
jgi:putative transcriptional regulator